MFLSSGDAFVRSFLSCIKGFKYRFAFQEGTWISLKMLQWEWASSCVGGENPLVFPEAWWKSVPFELQCEDPRAPTDHIASGKSGSHLEL